MTAAARGAAGAEAAGRPPSGRVRLYERALPAAIPSIGRVREELDAVLARAGVALPRREDIALAVTEATTNVVIHAYRRAAAPGPLEVEAGWAGAALVVEVRDRGCGMSPRLDSPGCRLGLALMSRLADVVQIQAKRPGGGTAVCLAFALAPGPAAPR